MAASWITPISDEPFLVAVSVWKGSLTHQYIKETREFTVNIPLDKHVNLVFRAGSISGREANKISLLGLKTTPSKAINTPGLEDMLGFLECKVTSEVDIGESTLFIAEVKAVHVREDLYTRYGWDLSKTRILLHHSGRGFTTTNRLILAEK
jgi:flavin reductase (DIM6/NTAB) family NADH-FMN oxidoreductase RutF